MSIVLIGGVGLVGYMVLNAPKAAGGAVAGAGQGLGGALAATGQGVGGAAAATATTGGNAIGNFFSGLGTLVNPPGYTWKGVQKHDDGFCWEDTRWPDGTWTFKPAPWGNC